MKDANGKEEIIKVMISLDKKHGVLIQHLMPPLSANVTALEIDLRAYYYKLANLNGIPARFAIKQIAIENGTDDMLLDRYDADQYEIKSGEIFKAKLEADNTLTLITF